MLDAMFMNRLPRTLEGLPIYEAVRQICQEDPIRPSTYESSIDPDLEAIIMMALETKREKRYQTAGAFGRDILRYLGNRSVKARKATATDHIKLFCRRHKRQLIAWSIVTTVVAITVSMMVYLRAESDQQVGDLRAEVDAVRKENAELKQATPAELEEVDEVKARLVLTLPSPPSQTVISEDGQTLAATIGDDYYATSLIPRSIPLPPINIEPSTATIGLSPKGTKLAVVSERRCRLVLLGQRKPPLQLTGDFSNVSAIAVGELALAIAGHDMSLQVSFPRKQLMRTTSMTGIYKAISFGSTDEQLLAATDHWVYYWRLQDFPKGARKFQGVNDPCLVRGYNQRLVVVGRSGQIEIHEPNKRVSPVQSLQLESKIEQCAMNKETTLLAYISNGKAYLHTIATGKTQELTWIPETPAGVAIGEINEVIVWTEDGKVYRR